jgi:hypothetical protein
MAGDPGQPQPVCSDPTTDDCRCCGPYAGTIRHGDATSHAGSGRAGRMISRGQLDKQPGGLYRFGLLR